MVRAYVIYGSIVCLLLAIANFSGWGIGDASYVASGPRGPGPRILYHK